MYALTPLTRASPKQHYHHHISATLQMTQTSLIMSITTGIIITNTEVSIPRTVSHSPPTILATSLQIHTFPTIGTKITTTDIRSTYDEISSISNNISNFNVIYILTSDEWIKSVLKVPLTLKINEYFVQYLAN